MTEAVEKTSTTTNWFQEFAYDRYGNITTPNGYVTDLYPTQTVAAYGKEKAKTLSKM